MSCEQREGLETIEDVLLILISPERRLLCSVRSLARQFEAKDLCLKTFEQRNLRQLRRNTVAVRQAEPGQRNKVVIRTGPRQSTGQFYNLQNVIVRSFLKAVFHYIEESLSSQNRAIYSSKFEGSTWTIPGPWAPRTGDRSAKVDRRSERQRSGLQNRQRLSTEFGQGFAVQRIHERRHPIREYHCYDTKPLSFLDSKNGHCSEYR